MRSLWTHWRRVADDLTLRPRLLLLLDFDGTLAPLEDAPHLARLSARTKTRIKRLKERCGVDVAIVSGRSIANIRRRVGLRSVYYAGNHGLEIEGPGLSFTHPVAAALKPALTDLAAAVRRDIRVLPGVFVENKGMTLSIHYRRLAARRVKELEGVVRTLRVRTRGLPFKWRTGHKVWELVPAVEWDKGCAALYLIRQLGRPFPLALGDDRTDEDMFRALLKKGITVRIGPRQPTRAVYGLASQAETDRFLAALESCLMESGRC